jgi:hypothetical protein
MAALTANVMHEGLHLLNRITDLVGYNHIVHPVDSAEMNKFTIDFCTTATGRHSLEQHKAGRKHDSTVFVDDVYVAYARHERFGSFTQRLYAAAHIAAALIGAFQSENRHARLCYGCVQVEVGHGCELDECTWLSVGRDACGARSCIRHSADMMALSAVGSRGTARCVCVRVRTPTHAHLRHINATVMCGRL